MGLKYLAQRQILAAVLAVSTSACSSPLLTGAQDDSTFEATSAAEGAPPMMRALPDVKFPKCTDGSCTFEGIVANEGPGCAKNVVGVTRLLDAAGKEIEARSWTLDGRVRPRAEMPFSGCCFSETAVGSYKTSRTDVSAEQVECI